MILRPIALAQALGFFFAGVSLFALQWMNLPHGPWLVPLAAVLSALALVAARQYGDAIVALLSRVPNFLPSWPAWAWVCIAIFLGVLLRILVETFFPVDLISDHKQYFDLARKLAEGQEYSNSDGHAFWPPGLPLALALLIRLFGTSAVSLYACITFGLTAIATFALGLKLGNARTAFLSALIVAIWPNFLFAAPILTKECLLVALWPASIYFYLRATESTSAVSVCLFAFLAGIAIGYAALTQPSSALLGGCLAVYSWVTAGWRRRTVLCLAFVACGMCAVVTPWTIRNYAVLHAFVPIATEGGINFFMVAQPSSDGRWSANYESPEALSQLTSDELERNRRGFLLGLEAIKGNPLHFLSTMMRKPLYMFGQDVKNVYWVFERGGAGTSSQYALAYWISNGFYVIIILIVTSFVIRKGYAKDTSTALLLPWMFLVYPIFAHILFEASERHRYAALPIMAIFAAMAFCQPLSERNPASGSSAAGCGHG